MNTCNRFRNMKQNNYYGNEGHNLVIFKNLIICVCVCAQPQTHMLEHESTRCPFIQRVLVCNISRSSKGNRQSVGHNCCCRFYNPYFYFYPLMPFPQWRRDEGLRETPENMINFAINWRIFFLEKLSSSATSSRIINLMTN